MKEKILKMTSYEELEELEEKTMKEYRENFYNELLKIPGIRQHIAKLYNVSEDAVDNVLLINGAFPIDDFDD